MDLTAVRADVFSGLDLCHVRLFISVCPVTALPCSSRLFFFFSQFNPNNLFITLHLNVGSFISFIKPKFNRSDWKVGHRCAPVLVCTFLYIHYKCVPFLYIYIQERRRKSQVELLERKMPPSLERTRVRACLLRSPVRTWNAPMVVRMCQRACLLPCLASVKAVYTETWWWRATHTHTMDRNGLELLWA